MKRLLCATLCALALGCNEKTATSPADVRTNPDRTPAVTQTPAGAPATGTNEPADHTNSGVNVRDRDSTTKTPLDQNENKADVRVTADIRKQVVDSKLSVAAQNVKIITQDGKVTLRGPVKTDGEKQRIEEIAVAVAGADNVDNQLEVT